MNAVDNMLGPHLKLEELNAAFNSYNQLISLQESDRRHITQLPEHLKWELIEDELDDWFIRIAPEAR